LVEDYTKTDSNLIYNNVFNAMLGEDGKPLPDIFVKDNLHMNAKGYALWTPIVREYLK
jgi:lysophospholipase L1-like esterase